MGAGNMANSHAHVPLAVKVGFSVFMAILFPIYLHYYGPTNFLYVCDVSMMLTLIGIWPENRLMISMCGVGILVLQTAWLVDFLVNLGGVSLTGVTDYMFDSSHPLFLRLLSLYHAWLPLLVAYLIWKVGYDRRAFWSWTALFWALLLVSYFLMPPPNPNPGLTPVNINYVWGPDDNAAQTWVPGYIWLAGLFIGLPLLVFAPTHLVLSRIVSKVR
jgi:hypothetical protein